jgi:hypothetical protein
MKDGRDERGRDGQVRAEAELSTVSRRGFLGAGTVAIAAFSGVTAGPALLGHGDANAFAIGPQTPWARRATAFQIRLDAALAEKAVPIPPHPTNDDEQRYATKIGSYTKGLPHDPERGEVVPAAYQVYLAALASGDQQRIDHVPLGCPARQRRLVDPLAGLAYVLEGTDSHQLYSPPAPAFASDEQAAEMVEDYWMALLRDVPFEEYGTSPLAQAAAADLSTYCAFTGPRERGQVTPGTLFRGVFPGDRIGPYVSQFRYLPAPLAATDVDQRIFPAQAGVDFVTDLPTWLDIENGCEPTSALTTLASRRYTVTGRDYAQWVHLDVSIETYVVAFLVLRALGAPYNPGNPYLGSRAQEGFATFGDQHIAALLAEVTTRAFKAVWFQKWFVHRRERPEDFAGRVELVRAGAASYPISAELFRSAALPLIFAHNAALNRGEGTYLLPQAYPEGSPLHPSYGEGHGVVAGACVTVLKAFYDETFVIPDPVIPDPKNPATLVPYVGPPLTVGGELNKLASNIALARDLAGVHWRSDALQGLLLGERVAISILRDQRGTFVEDFDGFTFTKFDGQTITV